MSYHQTLADAVSVSASKKGWMQVFLCALHEASLSRTQDTRQTHFLFLDDYWPRIGLHAHIPHLIFTQRKAYHGACYGALNS